MNTLNEYITERIRIDDIKHRKYIHFPNYLKFIWDDNNVYCNDWYISEIDDGRFGSVLVFWSPNTPFIFVWCGKSWKILFDNERTHSKSPDKYYDMMTNNFMKYRQEHVWDSPVELMNIDDNVEKFIKNFKQGNLI